MFANVVYILCAFTSTLCAILLLRGYRESRARLLFWSAVCFIGLAASNILLVVDFTVASGLDLSFWRVGTAIVGAGALVYALVWEAR
jgi:hypothetical protein